MMPETVAEFINLIFQNIRERRPGYSLRAFARDLELSPSFLSMLLRQQTGLSTEQAQKIGNILELSTNQKEHLMLLAEAEFSRNERHRHQALEQLSKNKKKHQFQDVENDYKEIIADWIHPAILEFCQIHQGQLDTKTMSQFFKRNEEDIHAAIERLKKLQLLSLKDGIYHVKEVNLQVNPGVASNAIRNFHRQIIQRALESMELDPMTDRYLNSFVIKVRKDKMNEFQKKIEQMADDLIVDLSHDEKADQVYGLSLQFFPLGRKDAST